jgi:Penicillinase repressor
MLAGRCGRVACAGFGDLETAIMHKVWDRDSPVTVRELLDELQQERASADTTVMSTKRIDGTSMRLGQHRCSIDAVGVPLNQGRAGW